MLKVSNTGTTASIPAIEGTIRSLDTAATLSSSNPIIHCRRPHTGAGAVEQPGKNCILRLGLWNERHPFRALVLQQCNSILARHAHDPGGRPYRHCSEKEIPTTFVLGQNYPNPFNPNDHQVRSAHSFAGGIDGL